MTEKFYSGINLTLVKNKITHGEDAVHYMGDNHAVIAPTVYIESDSIEGLRKKLYKTIDGVIEMSLHVLERKKDNE